MATKQLEKVQTLEKRVQLLERVFGIRVKKNSVEGLEMLYGLWKKRPRTKKDLQRVHRLVGLD